MPLFLPVPLYPDAKRDLWDLLLEREEWENISHSDMPSWQAHCEFVESEPYAGWFLIEDGGIIRGATYITDNKEVGVHVFKKYMDMGYEDDAFDFMEKNYGANLLANVSIRNARLMAILVKRGYDFLQVTFRKTRDNSRGGNRPSRLH